MKRVWRLLLAMAIVPSCSSSPTPDEPPSDPCPTCGDAAVATPITPTPDGGTVPSTSELSVALDPLQLIARPGSSSDVNLIVTRPADVTETLTLEVSNLPPNVSVVTAAIPGTRASFRLTLAANTPQGAYTLLVTVRGTTKTVTATLPVSIVGNPGELVTSFASGGRATSTLDFTLANVGVQPDGHIIAGGTGGAATARDHVIVRFDAAGLADAAFNTLGKSVADFGGEDVANDLLVLHDGKVVLSGYQTVGAAAAAQIVSRFTADGILDTTFATTGKLTLAPSAPSYGYGVREQPDGMLVFVGQVSTNCSATRITVQGALDSNFGAGGNAIMDMGSQDYCLGVALDAQGRVVMTGERFNGTGYDLVSGRFTAAGAIDGAFSSASGWVNSVAGAALNAFGWAIAVQPDGKVVVGGSGPGPSAGQDFVLFRYLDNGAPDTTFGQAGKAAFHVGTFDRVYRLAFDSQQRIVFVGSSATDTASQAVVMRLLANGTPDATFGQDGRATFDFSPTGGDSVQGLAILSDGKILIGGTSTDAVGNKPWVAKLWP